MPLPPASRIAFIATTDDIMWNAAMNLPNSLTISRIFFVPLLVVVLLTNFEGKNIYGMPTELVGAAIFGIASLPTGSTATSRAAASRSRCSARSSIRSPTNC